MIRGTLRAWARFVGVKLLRSPPVCFLGPVNVLVGQLVGELWPMLDLLAFIPSQRTSTGSRSTTGPSGLSQTQAPPLVSIPARVDGVRTRSSG